MREQLTGHFDAVLREILDANGDEGAVPEFALEAPRNPDHGDFACNAALLLAKRLRRAPRQIAEDIAERLGKASEAVERVEVAGPGFVNVWLAGSRWQALLPRVLEEGARYGRTRAGEGIRVQVEFVSANPTGPLTLGHGRQAVLGDAIARMLEAQGYEVTREYYFNDGGRQMRVLGESVRARYLEALGLAAPPPKGADADPETWPEAVDGLPIVFPKDGYQGEYIADLARDLHAEHGDALVDEPGDGLFREVAQTSIFGEIRKTLASLGIEFDVFSSEQDLYTGGHLEAVLGDLRARDLVYEGEGATWLRASAFTASTTKGNCSLWSAPCTSTTVSKPRRNFSLW